jgi:hypothetical protein
VPFKWIFKNTGTRGSLGNIVGKNKTKQTILMPSTLTGINLKAHFFLLSTLKRRILWKTFENAG